MLRGCEIPINISVDRIYSFFKTSFKGDSFFKGESNDLWEIMFVTDGTVGITADRDVYVLDKGQAVIYKPNEFHRIWSKFDADPKVIIISFCASVFPEFESRIVNVNSRRLKAIEQLYTMSEECFDRSGYFICGVKSGYEYETAHFRACLELFIQELMTKQSPRVSSAIKSAEIYSLAVKIMEENPDAGLCIEDIARRCNISSAYLKKIFEKYSGCGVIQYYNRLRARLACGYLMNGRSIKETALILGFGDQNYFSTFFKRIMGTSPSKYRSDTGKSSRGLYF